MGEEQANICIRVDIKTNNSHFEPLLIVGEHL